MLRPIFFALLITLSLIAKTTKSAQAQDDVRERRRKFIEEVLKNVLESQLSPDQARDNRGNPIPPNIRPPVNVPQDVVDVRRQIADFSAGMDQLVRGLYQSSDQSPLLRALAADALQIRAQNDAAAQAAASSTDLQSIATNFAFVDRQWRVFQHRVSQTPNLSRDLRRLIDQLNVNESNLCKALSLAPQLDRSELVRLSSSLVTGFEYLLQDLRLETRYNRSLDPFYREGEQFGAELRQSFANVERASYESIVANFRAFSAKWRRWSLDLRQVPSPRLQQDIVNVEQITAAITDLLWLTPEFDRDYLVDLLVAIRNDVDGLMSNVTLKDLIKAESPQAVVDSARGFQSACSSLAAAAATASGPQDLAWEQRAVDVSWAELQRRLKPLNVPAIQDRIASCNGSLEMLRQIFGSRSQVNYLDIESAIAELDELAHQLQEVAEAGLVRDRSYDQGFRAAFGQLTTQLHALSHSLHTRSARDHGLNVRPEDVVEVASTWDQLRRMFPTLREPHKQALGQIRAQFEPLLAKLRMVFTG